MFKFLYSYLKTATYKRLKSGFLGLFYNFSNNKKAKALILNKLGFSMFN